MQRLKTLGICMAVLSLVGIALAALTIKSPLTFFSNADGSFTATGELSGLGNKPARTTAAKRRRDKVRLRQRPPGRKISVTLTTTVVAFTT